MTPETAIEIKNSWRKNLDGRYISGEDMQSKFHELRPEMIVILDKIEDAETFDQNKNAKVVKTGIWLKELNGTAVYKPAILNKTNAKFFDKEFGTEDMDLWIGKTVTMFAQKDSRHGYVVRFKKYVLPVLQKDTEQFKNCYNAIHVSGFTIDKIRTKYQVSSAIETLLMTKQEANGTV